MQSGPTTELWSRFRARIEAWGVVVERVSETSSSLLAFGRRDTQPVVLKVARRRGDEWRAGEILDTFEGRGVVRVYDYVDGATLLERLNPGTSLVSMSVSGADDDAIAVLAGTIRTMSPRTPTPAVATVMDWGKGFERYAESGDGRIPRHLVATAQRVYAELCDSESGVRLLHGDLHHGNVLFDFERGWLAIDPKGVIGEREYELGAALRNPGDRPELFTDPVIIRKRVDRFARELELDAGRVLSWAFAQAVLSAIWEIEDGYGVEPDNGSLALADSIRSMLEGS